MQICLIPLRLLFVCATICLSVASLQAQQNKGWTTLFNGENLEGWKQLGGKSTYEVVNGAIMGTVVAKTGNSFLATEKTYRDFVLELDVMIEDTANNSGIQIRSHYDPAGNNGNGKVYGKQCEIDPKARAWTGGIYDEGRRGWLYPLTLNPPARKAFKVGEYNRFRIECIGNETRTWVNGQPVSFLVDTLDSEGFIALQVHSGIAGKRVFFKNIRIQTENLKPARFGKNIYVENLSANTLTEYEKKNGWKLLFDGHSSEGWRSATGPAFPASGWEIKDGILTVLASEGTSNARGGDIITNEQYRAFDLSFFFRLTPGANSGVKYFVKLADQTGGDVIGLEYQLLDDAKHPDATQGKGGNRTLASLYDLIKADKPKSSIRPIGEWNTGRIVVHRDNRVEHYLNGAKVLEYQRGSAAYRKLVADSKYAKYPAFGEAVRGPILLQDHGNEVQFKNIKIKAL